MIARPGGGFLHDTEDGYGIIAVDGEEWKVELAGEAADGRPGDGFGFCARGRAWGAACGGVGADEKEWKPIAVRPGDGVGPAGLAGGGCCVGHNESGCVAGWQIVCGGLHAAGRSGTERKTEAGGQVRLGSSGGGGRRELSESAVAGWAGEKITGREMKQHGGEQRLARGGMRLAAFKLANAQHKSVQLAEPMLRQKRIVGQTVDLS